MNELSLSPEKEGPTGLADAIGMILDKGLVINADITVSVVGVELLGVKIRAALASFETAAKYGLEFPSGTNLNAPAWRAIAAKESCPHCGKLFENALKKNECPLCGWKEQENWK